MTGESTRDVYRRTLLELATADDRIYCVDSDMGGLEDTFAAELPGQYVNVGIAEANLFGVSAGLALAGLIPFANTMSAFALWRAGEQLRTDIAANQLPVRVVVTHGGAAAGHYGPSHHALDDLAVARVLPGTTVLVPADAAETERAIRAVVHHPGPVLVRLGRAATPPVTGGTEFVPGVATELVAGQDVTIIATGPLPVHRALRAAQLLASDGIAARVLNMHTIAPIDTAAITSAARQTAGIVTVEDHVVLGGLGGAVCEVVCAEHPAPVRRIGTPSAYLDRVDDEAGLLTAAGITPEAIAAAGRDILAGRVDHQNHLSGRENRSHGSDMSRL